MRFKNAVLCAFPRSNAVALIVGKLITVFIVPTLEGLAQIGRSGNGKFIRFTVVNGLHLFNNFRAFYERAFASINGKVYVLRFCRPVCIQRHAVACRVDRIDIFATVVACAARNVVPTGEDTVFTRRRRQFDRIAGCNVDGFNRATALHVEVNFVRINVDRYRAEFFEDEATNSNFDLVHAFLRKYHFRAIATVGDRFRDRSVHFYNAVVSATNQIPRNYALVVGNGIDLLIVSVNGRRPQRIFIFGLAYRHNGNFINTSFLGKLARHAKARSRRFVYGRAEFYLITICAFYSVPFDLFACSTNVLLNAGGRNKSNEILRHFSSCGQVVTSSERRYLNSRFASEALK